MVDVLPQGYLFLLWDSAEDDNSRGFMLLCGELDDKRIRIFFPRVGVPVW